MTEDFSHLVPLSARGRLDREGMKEIQQQRVAGKEHRMVMDLVSALGSDRQQAEEAAEGYGGFLDFSFAWHDLSFLIPLAYAEVKKFSFTDLYTAPTKSEVWSAFVEHLRETKKGTESSQLIMPFTAKNANQRVFCMHNVEAVVRDSKVFLTFVVRNERHFIQPWKEVLDAIRRKRGEGMEA